MSYEAHMQRVIAEKNDFKKHFYGIHAMEDTLEKLLTELERVQKIKEG